MGVVFVRDKLTWDVQVCIFLSEITDLKAGVMEERLMNHRMKKIAAEHHKSPIVVGRASFDCT